MAKVAVLPPRDCSSQALAALTREPRQRLGSSPTPNETGTTIRQDWPTDYAKIQSMVDNDQVIWDVVNVRNDFGLQSTGDLLEPLDYSVIDKEPILEGYASEYRIACMLYANILAYNTEQIDGTPSSWADLFDTQKFPGQRGLA